MATAVISADQDAIVSEIEVAAPPERVFEALSDPRQLLKWWGEEGECKAQLWEMDARLGGKWRFRASDATGKVAVNNVRDFEAHGEITEYDPPRTLAYTWIANWHDQPGSKTHVRWELSPTAAGTRVKVTHSGLKQQAVARKDYAGGWPGVLQLLNKYFES